MHPVAPVRYRAPVIAQLALEGEQAERLSFRILEPEHHDLALRVERLERWEQVPFLEKGVGLRGMRGKVAQLRTLRKSEVAPGERVRAHATSRWLRRRCAERWIVLHHSRFLRAIS